MRSLLLPQLVAWTAEYSAAVRHDYDECLADVVEQDLAVTVLDYDAGYVP